MALRPTRLPDHVPEAVKEERYDRLMRHQQAISAELLASRVGKTVEVIVDRDDGERRVARSPWDAPEIDGKVYLDGAAGLAPGDRLKVRIEDADEYDLWARPVAPSARPVPAAERASGVDA